MQLRVEYPLKIMKKPICIKRASVRYVILNLSFELEPKIALLIISHKIVS